MTLLENPWAEIEIDIQFHDLDPMEIVWHGRYVKYFELARCKLFDAIGYNYPEMKDSGYAWPVVDLQIRYIQSITFRQKIIVRATVDDYENRLKIRYAIRDAESGQRLTKGYTCQVAVDMKSKELQLASPAILLERLQTWSRAE